MLVLDLRLSAEQVLEECGRRGLVVRSERELAGRTGSRHWHLRVPGGPGLGDLEEAIRLAVEAADFVHTPEGAPRIRHMRRQDR